MPTNMSSISAALKEYYGQLTLYHPKARRGQLGTLVKQLDMSYADQVHNHILLAVDNAIPKCDLAPFSYVLTDHHLIRDLLIQEMTSD